MAGLIGINGQELNPKPRAGGISVIGRCPTCKAPIIYHGGGEQVVQQSRVDEQVALVPAAIMPTCGCYFEKDLDMTGMETPGEYNLLLEREALLEVFERLHTMIYSLSEMMNQGLKRKKPAA